MPRATVFEEHASVLPHWVGQGLQGATLVCLDAHLDLQFIEPARIARLAACATAADMARLESPHPLSPRRDGCFGIEDFLYAAARLGVIRRLVWVAPPHVLRTGLSALQALQQMEGVTGDELASFHRTADGWTEGRLLGLDLALGELAQLSGMALSGPVALDIDTDYFVQVPEDRVWAQPAAVVGALKQWGGAEAPLTIARSVGTGFLPLRHRFLADQLAALWEGRADDAQHWQALLELELAQLPPADRLAGLRAACARRPDCAASCHALALAVPTAGERQVLLARAAALDPHYADDLVRKLGEYQARWKAVDLATVRRLQQETAALRDSPERLAIAWTALGLLYTAFGRLEDAMACDAQARDTGAAAGAGHPDLALGIARLHMAAGAFAQAQPWLERAAQDDETRVAAWYQLSVCAWRRGAQEEALRWGEAACRAAPAWPEPRQWLAALGAGSDGAAALAGQGS